MSYVFNILPELNLVSVRAHGRVTAEGLKELLVAYGTHPHARPGQNILHDLSRITDCTISDGQRVAIQTIVEPLFRAGRTERKMVMFTADGISNTFATAMCNGFWQDTRYVQPYVTTSHSTACALLGIPLQPFSAFHVQAA